MRKSKVDSDASSRHVMLEYDIQTTDNVNNHGEKTSGHKMMQARSVNSARSYCNLTRRGQHYVALTMPSSIACITFGVLGRSVPLPTVIEVLLCKGR